MLLALAALACSAPAVSATDDALTCVAPEAQRIAGGSIDFYARISLADAVGGDGDTPRIEAMELCGAFSGKQICGLMAMGDVSPRPLGHSTGASSEFDVKFQLVGFTQPAVHEYTLWLRAKSSSAPTDPAPRLAAALSSTSVAGDEK